MDQLPSIRMTWDRSSGQYRKAGPARSASTVTEHYLRGPIPLAWLQKAARLPGRALAVGMAVWHLAGLRGSQQHLSLSTERLAPFGVSRYAKDRALRYLIAAGLVTVARKKGRSPSVSLIVAGKSGRRRHG